MSFHYRYSATFQNRPVQQPAVLVSPLDRTVQLLLEDKEAGTFVLTDTILPKPATVTTFNHLVLHFLTCNCCFVHQPQVRWWQEVRSNEKLGLPLQSPLACTNHKLLNQVHLHSCPRPTTTPEPPERRLWFFTTGQTVKVARLCCKPDWAGNPPTKTTCLSGLTALLPQEGTHNDHQLEDGRRRISSMIKLLSLISPLFCFYSCFVANYHFGLVFWIRRAITKTHWLAEGESHF